VVRMLSGGLVSKSRTLPSKSRMQVLRAYRSRGRANRNMWLVYSQKTNRDWMLGSDRHLVHWITFLETNPDVRTFELESVDGLSSPGAAVTEKGVDAAVELRDGQLEYHLLILSGRRKSPHSPDNVYADKRVRVFTEVDLFPRGEEAMRWLHLVGYCAGIRDEEQQEATLACIATLRGLRRGTLSQVLESLTDFDPQVTIGVFLQHLPWPRSGRGGARNEMVESVGPWQRASG
jgi:hypothetical protein